MNAKAKIILVLVLGLLSVHAADREKTLFDSEGDAVAYIAFDDELNIYLWGGAPVAYLKRETGEINIYGFNGTHLGWFERGIIWNHKGSAVGFVEGAVNKTTKLERIKGLRKLAPLRRIERLPPKKPAFRTEFSDTPLKAFLMQGAKDY